MSIIENLTVQRWKDCFTCCLRWFFHLIWYAVKGVPWPNLPFSCMYMSISSFYGTNPHGGWVWPISCTYLQCSQAYIKHLRSCTHHIEFYFPVSPTQSIVRTSICTECLYWFPFTSRSFEMCVGENSAPHVAHYLNAQLTALYENSVECVKHHSDGRKPDDKHSEYRICALIICWSDCFQQNIVSLLRNFTSASIATED